MTTPDSATEGCPPPLMWQEVRREFLAQSESLMIDSVAGPMAVRVWGSGPPIYLLPGFTSPAELYCLLVWLLRDDFRCVTIEPLATLRSSIVPSAPFANDVDMVRGVADELGDAEFSILGANFGAAWGLAAAQAMPSRVTRLMLMQGFAHRRLSFLERRLAGWCRHSRRHLANLPWRETIQTQNHRRWFPPFDLTRWQYYLDATGAMPLRELARRADAVARFDVRSQLSEIAVRTLLVRTEGEGQVSAACQAELERSLPNVQAEWLHNSGQLSYLTHPHRLAKLMCAFCAEAHVEHCVSDTS